MRRSATIVAAFGFGGIVASLFYFLAALHGADHALVTAAHPLWIETKWPFLMDQWGEGKAFQCRAADCGVELNLYIRPKIGFCSNTTGVADDAELERLSDFDFMNGKIAALGAGHEINIAWMKGRLRAYAIAAPARAQATAISIAYNNNSDALVATVMLNGAPPDTVEALVIAFLNGKPMLRWVTDSLGS